VDRSEQSKRKVYRRTQHKQWKGNYHFFFRKGGKSFAADFIRRYKKKKEQLQLPNYTHQQLPNYTHQQTADKNNCKKSETRKHSENKNPDPTGEETQTDRVTEVYC
jgi:hypothetical protein